MSEKSTFTETLRAGIPVHVGGVTLVPIEHVVLRSEMGIVGAWFSVAKQPYALIVRDATGIRTVDIDAAISRRSHWGNCAREFQNSTHCWPRRDCLRPATRRHALRTATQAQQIPPGRIAERL